MDVVVVESPAKAKTINKYLGRNYKVLASFGHVRDLPAKDGSVRPDDDFAMSWEVDSAVGQAADRHRQGGEGRRRPDPRHRPGSRGRSDLLACAGGAEAEARAEGQAGQPRRLQRHHQAVRARRHGQSARHRCAAGRRLSGAPRARLSRRLHPVAGAVAQAAGRPLGRPRPVGGAAAGLRPRGRDRALRAPGILADRRHSRARRATRRSRRGSPASKASGCRSSTSSTRRAGRRHQGHARRRDVPRRSRSRPSRPSAIPAPPFTTSTLQQAASSRLGFSAVAHHAGRAAPL